MAKIKDKRYYEEKYKAVSESYVNRHRLSPLNKEKETFLLERIVHELVQNTKKVNFKKVDDKVFVLCKGLKPINLYELVRKVNFTQLSLYDLDLNTYAYNKILHEEQQSHHDLIERITAYDKTHPNSGLSKLHYGELIALRKYSIDSTLMNMFLRNVHTMELEHIPQTLLHCAIASHGLNKLPDTKLDVVIRREGLSRLEELQLAFTMKEVISEHAFVSTTLKDTASILVFPDDIKLLYKLVKGKNITPISHFYGEGEYLIPASAQIRLTGHIEENGKHIFTAEEANVLLATRKDVPITRDNLVNIYLSYHDTKPILLLKFNNNEAKTLFYNEVLNKSFRLGIDIHSFFKQSNTNDKEIIIKSVNIAYNNLGVFIDKHSYDLSISLGHNDISSMLQSVLKLKEYSYVSNKGLGVLYIKNTFFDTTSYNNHFIKTEFVSQTSDIGHDHTFHSPQIIDDNLPMIGEI